MAFEHEDLRESLAAKLKAVGDFAYKNEHPRMNTRGSISEHYRAMAEECIRQMEWVRRSVYGEWARDEGYGNHFLGDGKPMTPAPDNWTPPTIDYRPTPDPNGGRP